MTFLNFFMNAKEFSLAQYAHNIRLGICSFFVSKKAKERFPREE